MIRTIAEQSSDVAAIIDDLLVAARVEIGRVRIHSERVDLLVELHTATHTLPGKAERIRIPRETAIAVGDRLRVRQILRNLLSNAVRHGGPEVVVEITPDDRMVGVSVADDGPGIPPIDRPHLFDPYFHEAGAVGQPASIGLGLTVSRQLARLMGGDLVYQDAERWSVFRLILPLEPIGRPDHDLIRGNRPLEAGRSR
jgi:two-component system OmpR family sensor kinase